MFIYLAYDYNISVSMRSITRLQDDVIAKIAHSRVF